VARPERGSASLAALVPATALFTLLATAPGTAALADCPTDPHPGPVAAGSLRTDRPQTHGIRPHGPKNVIVMVGDGMGFNHVAVTDLYQYGRTGQQTYQGFPVRLAMSTHNSSGSYDPQATWSDFFHALAGPTDSAAAATALSTGYKTHNAMIGIDPDGEQLVHAFERAEGTGRATGVVTSVQLSHATPAGFVTHITNRSRYSEIANQMVYASATDVVMGAGHPCFDTQGQDNGCTGVSSFVGLAETWNDLSDADGALGADADGDGDQDPWTLVQTRAEFQDLTRGRTPRRVFGVAQVADSLQYARYCNPAEIPPEMSVFQACAEIPYSTPRNEAVPTLAEMTTAALNVLDEDPDGLALMVEGGAIDRAAHGNDLARLVEEQLEFNQAVTAVAHWVERHGGWRDTLVVVTADHETGYLTGPGSGADTGPDGGPRWNPVVSRGKGVLPLAEFHDSGHTNSLVPLYAHGNGMALLAHAADQRDPVRGHYLDNAELGQVLNRLLD
jgi:alkaline phosphatase